MTTGGCDRFTAATEPGLQANSTNFKPFLEVKQSKLLSQNP